MATRKNSYGKKRGNVACNLVNFSGGSIHGVELKILQHWGNSESFPGSIGEKLSPMFSVHESLLLGKAPIFFKVVTDDFISAVLVRVGTKKLVNTVWRRIRTIQSIENILKGTSSDHPQNCKNHSDCFRKRNAFSNSSTTNILNAQEINFESSPLCVTMPSASHEANKN